ncbi:uncharacterized protein JCM10292_003124 [Rhodotorula paludigena]|uniref:uncharacterized protein n=1 Tax=Rhodotorula paludigena TaxID=86838 RepID=UPI003177B738
MPCVTRRSARTGTPYTRPSSPPLSPAVKTARRSPRAVKVQAKLEAPGSTVSTSAMPVKRAHSAANALDAPIAPSPFSPSRPTRSNTRVRARLIDASSGQLLAPVKTPATGSSDKQDGPSIPKRSKVAHAASLDTPLTPVASPAGSSSSLTGSYDLRSRSSKVPAAPSQPCKPDALTARDSGLVTPASSSASLRRTIKNVLVESAVQTDSQETCFASDDEFVEFDAPHIVDKGKGKELPPSEDEAVLYSELWKAQWSNTQLTEVNDYYRTLLKHLKPAISCHVCREAIVRGTVPGDEHDGHSPSAECVIVSRHSTSSPPATSPSGTGSSVGEPAVEHEEPINAVAPEEHVVDEAVIDGASDADDEDEENDECYSTGESPARSRDSSPEVPAPAPGPAHAPVPRRQGPRVIHETVWTSGRPSDPRFQAVWDSSVRTSKALNRSSDDDEDERSYMRAYVDDNAPPASTALAAEFAAAARDIQRNYEAGEPDGPFVARHRLGDDVSDDDSDGDVDSARLSVRYSETGRFEELPDSDGADSGVEEDVAAAPQQNAQSSVAAGESGRAPVAIRSPSLDNIDAAPQAGPSSSGAIRVALSPPAASSSSNPFAAFVGPANAFGLLAHELAVRPPAAAAPAPPAPSEPVRADSPPAYTRFPARGA